VCRHDDQIKFLCLGEVGDLCRCIARQQNSGALVGWKLRLEERIELLSSKVLLFFGNFGERPYVELECVVTVEIEDVNRVILAPKMAAALFTWAALATHDGEKSTGNKMFRIVTMD
jgi:hypothetical protein